LDVCETFIGIERWCAAALFSLAGFEQALYGSKVVKSRAAIAEQIEQVLQEKKPSDLKD